MQLWALRRIQFWLVWSNEQRLHTWTIWTLKYLSVISNFQPSAFIIHIYSLLSLDILKAIKYYIINLPDTSKILSYTDHSNWFATAAQLSEDWKAADTLCGGNNCRDVWVKQWGIANKTENRATVRKWNVIVQLEFGQYGRQILSIPEEGNIRTLNYTMLEPQIYFWLKHKSTHELLNLHQFYLLDNPAKKIRALGAWMWAK